MAYPLRHGDECSTAFSTNLDIVIGHDVLFSVTKASWHRQITNCSKIFRFSPSPTSDVAQYGRISHLPRRRRLGTVRIEKCSSSLAFLYFNWLRWPKTTHRDQWRRPNSFKRLCYIHPHDAAGAPWTGSFNQRKDLKTFFYFKKGYIFVL